MKKYYLFKRFQTVADIVSRTESYSIGGGEASVEYYDEQDNFIFEAIYDNGTRSSIEDQEKINSLERQRVDEILQTPLSLHEKINLRGLF